MKTKPKQIPKFKTEDEERDFWAEHSPLDYFDLSTARRVTFPNLKRTTKSISIRLPEALIDELKVLANKYDVPYQSLAKIYLARGVAMERRALFADQKTLAVAEDPVKYGSKS
ncbi:MAG: BrnA antitoxin family protein [Kiritimatiellales bacterium]|jgi:predicted DNA binding CopG/RHH family protein